MAETRFPLELPPGFRRNGTTYQAKGRYVDGNLVRFYQGSIRPWGGWEARTLTGDGAPLFAFGTPRAAIRWTPEIIGAAQPPILAVGTTTGLYIIIDDEVTDITPAEVTGNRATRLWTLQVFGSYLIACMTDTADYLESEKLFVWTGDVTESAALITEAPASPTSVVVTDERFILQLGGVDPNGVTFENFPDVPSTRTVLWASRERLTDWVSTNVNTAGSFPLATDGKLLCGRRGRGETLIWTTTDMHKAVFIGGEFVFSFRQAGTECGAISINSPVMVNGGAFWMGPNGFYAYDGFVKTLESDVQEYVFGRLDRSLQHLVWGMANPAFGEIVWFYPSVGSGDTDSYVVYNYLEGHWTTGSLARTCGVVNEGRQTPIMMGPTFTIYDHEVGTSKLDEDAEEMLGFLETGPIEFNLAEVRQPDQGGRVMRIQGMIPDELNLGSLETRLYTAFESSGTETEHGPYPHAERTDMRASGRQVRLRYDEVDPAGDWRLGVNRLIITIAGRR